MLEACFGLPHPPYQTHGLRNTDVEFVVFEFDGGDFEAECWTYVV
jgi:hypothetical protein